jgi:hypothetical protein
MKLPMKDDTKTLGILLAAVLTFGCGGTAAAPLAGSSEGFIPDLRGRQVMVFPVQIRTGVAGDASPEIVFTLRARGTDIVWIFPDELEALLVRASGRQCGERTAGWHLSQRGGGADRTSA